MVRWLAACLLLVLASGPRKHARNRGPRGSGAPAATAEAREQPTKVRQGTPKGTIERSIKTGNYRHALMTIRPALERDPDNADLHAWMGVAFAGIGSYGDALVSLGFGRGSAVYEQRGIDAEADALREMGHGREAAALRLELLVGEQELQAELATWVGAIDDLLAAGDPWEAETLAWRAFARVPDSDAVHAALADALFAMGEADEAEWHLWFALRVAEPSMRTECAHIQALLREGDLAAADRASEVALQHYRRSARIIALRARVLRRIGVPENALILLERARWREYEYPNLLIERALSLAAADRAEEAKDVARRVVELYPDNAEVRRAARRVGVQPP